MMRKNPLAAPVIKWFSGKQPPPEELAPLLPKRIASYCEPFLGNAAVLFWLQPASACLCDINPELIEMYETIRDQAEELIAVLERHPNLENHYRLVRDWDRDKKQYGKLSRVQRAARIIYLSRTCYNGIYRVNAAGEFDTPFGHYRRVVIADVPTLRAVSAYLRQAKISFCTGDYTRALTGLPRDTFVYFDPPYDTGTAALRGGQGFDRSEHIRLRRCCDELNRRGIRFMLTGAATDFMLKQYAGYNITALKARLLHTARAAHGTPQEIAIRNYG